MTYLRKVNKINFDAVIYLYLMHFCLGKKEKLCKTVPRHCHENCNSRELMMHTVKILKFGTPQTIAIIVLKIEKFDVTLHKCIQKTPIEWQTA